jgi:predicted DNA binding protein
VFALKALRIIMKQCQLLSSYKPEDYLGSYIGNCPRKIEHIIVSGGKTHRVKVSCDKCVYAELLKTTHIIGHPIVDRKGYIQFLVVNTRRVRKILDKHIDQLIAVEELDARSLYLTERQREVFRLFASKDVSSVGTLSQRLGISKPAASKLFRKTLSKLAMRYIGDRPGKPAKSSLQ